MILHALANQDMIRLLYRFGQDLETPITTLAQNCNFTFSFLRVQMLYFVVFCHLCE